MEANGFWLRPFPIGASNNSSHNEMRQTGPAVLAQGWPRTECNGSMQSKETSRNFIGFFLCTMLTGKKPTPLSKRRRKKDPTKKPKAKMAARNTGWYYKF
jgi:hypothetical protein